MKILKIFHVFTLITSILTITNNLNNLLVPTILISLIGIIGSVLFFLKKYNFNYLMIIWICSQFIYFTFGNFSLDLSQFFNWHLSFNAGPISIGGNIQIVLFVFLKPIMLTKYLNKNISIKPYTENSPLKANEVVSFFSKDIKSKKIIGELNYMLNDVEFNNIIFDPISNDKIQKAGIILNSSNHSKKINATVTYEFNK